MRDLQRKDTVKNMGANSLMYALTPPQVPEMEDTVIGACLMERPVFNQIQSIIPNGDCFYMEGNQLAYQAMLDLEKSGYAIDLITVTEELRRTNKLTDAGGAYRLMQVSKDGAFIANIEDHARVVMEKYFYRELIRVGMQAVKAGYDQIEDVFTLIEETKYNVNAILKDIEAGGDSPIGRIFLEVVKELEYQKNHKTALTGVDTGLYDLNDITCGLQKTDLIILAARPSKGKTALSLNLSLSAAISTLVEKVPVGFFSLEMGATQLVKRMASTVTGIDFEKVKSGNLTDEEFKTIEAKSRYFHTLPIHIADQTYNLAKIIAKARKWKEKHDIGLLVIDYLGLIRVNRHQGGNREQEVAGITRDLKGLAKELDIPVLLLAQLNRAVESRTSPEPQPSDLRESGAIEQDADLIICPWHTVDNSFISIIKHRNGKTAVGEHALKIKFAGSIQKWMNPEAFEPFKETFIPDNARAGITNNYQREAPPVIDEDTPF